MIAAIIVVLCVIAFVAYTWIADTGQGHANNG